MSKRITKTLTITFAGRTEEVVFSGLQLDDGRRVAIWNHEAFAARIGRGAKAYRAAVAAWPIEGMHENTRKAYGRSRTAPIVVDDEGTEWGVNLASCTVRNRQAQIVGWAEDFAGTTAAAQHDAYSSLRKS